MIRLQALLGALCLSYTGYTQEVRIKLENCKLDPTVQTEIKNSLYFQIQFYAEIFSDKTVNSFKARVFGTEREFQKYAKSEANFNPTRSNAIAFYSPKLNEMILHKEINDFPGTFSHEMSHAIINHYCKNIDTWLDEGLAELVEDVILVDSSYVFDSRQVNKVRNAEAFFRAGASVGNMINGMDFYSSANEHKNYTLAWATVMYLYRVDSKLLFKMITANCQNPKYYLDATYPGGLSVLDSDVRSFFLNNKPSAD